MTDEPLEKHDMDVDFHEAKVNRWLMWLGCGYIGFVLVCFALLWWPGWLMVSAWFGFNLSRILVPKKNLSSGDYDELC